MPLPATRSQTGFGTARVISRTLSSFVAYTDICPAVPLPKRYDKPARPEEPRPPGRVLSFVPRLLRPGRAEAAVVGRRRHPVGGHEQGPEPGRGRRGRGVLHGRNVPARLHRQGPAVDPREPRLA